MRRRKFLNNLALFSGTAVLGLQCHRPADSNKENNITGTPALHKAGTIIEPEHEIPVIEETDVLVIGGPY